MTFVVKAWSSGNMNIIYFTKSFVCCSFRQTAVQQKALLRSNSCCKTSRFWGLVATASIYQFKFFSYQEHRTANLVVLSPVTTRRHSWALTPKLFVPPKSVLDISTKCAAWTYSMRCRILYFLTNFFIRQRNTLGLITATSLITLWILTAFNHPAS